MEKLIAIDKTGLEELVDTLSYLTNQALNKMDSKEGLLDKLTLVATDINIQSANMAAQNINNKKHIRMIAKTVDEFEDVTKVLTEVLNNIDEFEKRAEKTFNHREATLSNRLLIMENKITGSLENIESKLGRKAEVKLEELSLLIKTSLSHVNIKMLEGINQNILIMQRMTKERTNDLKTNDNRKKEILISIISVFIGGALFSSISYLLF